MRLDNRPFTIEEAGEAAIIVRQTFGGQVIAVVYCSGSQFVTTVTFALNSSLEHWRGNTYSIGSPLQLACLLTAEPWPVLEVEKLLYYDRVRHVGMPLVQAGPKPLEKSKRRKRG